MMVTELSWSVAKFEGLSLLDELDLHAMVCQDVLIVFHPL